MTNPTPEQTVTFSDATKLREGNTLSLEDAVSLDAMSFKEYCERNPSASECKEYDV
jgi:hypothetical protein